MGADFGASFLNCKEGKVVRLTLTELGHPHLSTPVHCDVTTATGIANSPVKKQCARSMEMKLCSVSDQVSLDIFQVQWHPGQENLADYQSKHHSLNHHVAVCPWYLHTEYSPRLLPSAIKPSILRGCVETRSRGYTKGSPLPRVPNRQNVMAAATLTLC